MRIRGSAVVAAFVILFTTRAHAAPNCQTGASCRELGRASALGDGVVPDHAAAAAAWAKGCDQKDARSCFDLARLLRMGWTLEVERDATGADDRLAQAIELATPACNDHNDGDACLTLALASRDQLDHDGWPKDQKDRGAALLALASKACKADVLEACLMMRRDLWPMVSAEMVTGDEMRAKLDEAATQLIEMCKDGDATACLEAAGEMVGGDKSKNAVIAQIKKLCDQGKPDACLAHGLLLAAQITNLSATDPTTKEAVAALTSSCAETKNGLCDEIGEAMMKDDGDFATIGANDPVKGMKILRFQCEHGERQACIIAAAAAKSDADDLLDRSCKLSAPVDPSGAPMGCDACAEHPNLPECKRRDTFGVSVRCQGGSVDACETLGDRYLAGDGVDVDDKSAAKSYKEACDASIKGACGKLDDVCHADGAIGHDLCAPSLLHTDVFYEAEWQMRTSKEATLSSGTAVVGAEGAVTLGGAAASVSGGVSVERGHLDADLVVSVVLDRARQAAVKLVVEELDARSHGTGLRTYMRDLLLQGAQLLADTTSLRRDALQDLGMTLVRAFAASNLVRTVLGDAAAMKRAPVIGAVVEGWSEAQLSAPELSAYLADLAYWTLGSEPLLQRNGSAEMPAPACPWSDARAKLCEALSTREHVEAALHVDGVLTALNMVRALDSSGAIDVRRLIEAIVQSTSIVDFESTPGLDLSQWQSRLVDELGHRFAAFRDRMDDLANLINVKTYADDGPDLITLAHQAVLVRAFLKTPDARGFIDAGVAGDLSVILAFDHWASPNLKEPAGPEQLTKARADALAALKRLGSTWHSDLIKKLLPVRKKIDGVTDQLDELGRDITAVRAALEHHQRMGTDTKEHLAIDDLPLSDLDELLAIFPKVVDTLDSIDTGVRDVLPGVDLRGLRFARSSVVRLLGFLDLMSRVARSVRQTETVKQVVDTLALLGRWKDGEFTAPLFDMLSPVLDFIETRNPMPLEQLFAIIGRVRLDSLVTSLHIDQSDPCAKEDRAECWVFKIAYSLQESITRDGDNIKIDGAEVAKRLARFGDDFRRKHKGRWYFHLTVGMGTLWSTEPDTTERRFTPLISEQIGFGWATPAVWKDRLTFKIGVSASGILYRMLLDNAESKSVMGNAFVAVDIYDLVELYGAATVLAYPPSDMTKTTIEPGLAFGLSVPLSAYLEKL